MRKMTTRKVYVSEVTCSKCGKKKEFWHHGCETKKEAEQDFPEQTWNGWFVGKKGKELCPPCHYDRLLKNT